LGYGDNRQITDRSGGDVCRAAR